MTISNREEMVTLNSRTSYWKILLCLVGLFLPGLAQAQTPADPIDFGDVYAPRALGLTACGLVETDWQDPDWLMATSDLILRTSDCVAECAGCRECWYEQPFNPCYNATRYWKFEDNSGTAFAFTMAALGVGSFDGIYIRRNVKFQLYAGGDESNPFGPQMTGPKYISIDFWVTGNPACEGFDPNTFFVTGGPGALANYSIKIGGDTTIEELDVKEDDNEAEHHTDKFGNPHVLRRDSTFEIEVKLGKEFGPGCHEIYLEAKHEFDGSETIINVPGFDDPPPTDVWATEFIEAMTNGDETKTVKLKVHVPSTAPIGKYEFKALVRNRNTLDPTDEEEFPKPVYLVFNPWGSLDAVALASESQRNEYVLNETGRIWRGDLGSASAITWRFDQFGDKTLEVAMHLLEGASSSLRANPRLVSRWFSKLTNVEDEGGVIWGNWTGNYGGGQPPWYWTGSDHVIAAYGLSRTPVKYGQCWVFGGVLTSFLRSVGVPSRPVSTFNAGWDKDTPPNKAIDYYMNSGGMLDLTLTKDSIWNYHVWCDVWTGEWSAVDASAPLFKSDGFYQIGPAPHSAIRTNAGGAYDVDFVFGEVDADWKFWRDGGAILDRVDSTYIGRNITTKAVGSSAAQDITSSYKTPEPNPFFVRPRSTLMTVGVDVLGSTPLGTDATWAIRVTNNGAEPWTANVRGTVDALVYDGTLFQTMQTIQVDRPVAPGATEQIDVLVDADDYASLTGSCDTLEARLSVVAMGPSGPLEVYLGAERTVLTTPEPTISLTGPNSIPMGGMSSVRGMWKNPLAQPMTNVTALFSVGRGLLVEGVPVLEVPVGSLGPGQAFDLERVITAVLPGEHTVHLTVLADQITGATTDLVLDVFADCNDNGVDDALDISGGASFDCNGNSTPDECETDCNLNGIPDDCDVIAEPSSDCNANGVPDSCDVEAGSSGDLNANGVPDECDEDCNNNDIPDDYEIATGAASDFNGNGVPDACDSDCNGNGISDEVDITNGTSTDINQNGVPDDCESGVGAVFPCFEVETFQLQSTYSALMSSGSVEYGSSFDPAIFGASVEVINDADQALISLDIPVGGLHEWIWNGDLVYEYEAPITSSQSYRVVFNVSQCSWRFDVSSGIDLGSLTGPEFSVRIEPTTGGGVASSFESSPGVGGWLLFTSPTSGTCCD